MFFLKNICFLIYFGCAESLLLHGLSSIFGEWRCASLSLRWLPLLQSVGSRVLRL